MNRNEKFGQRLRDLRKEKEINDGRKWTCKDVSKEIGITESGYTNYENALRIPKLDVIEQLAAFYNVSPSYIACFTDNKGNSNNESLLIMPELTLSAKDVCASPLGDYGLSPELLNNYKINKNKILIERITDNSMAGHLIKDDLVIINMSDIKDIDNLSFNIYCLKSPSGAIFIRWVKPEINGQYKVYPNNTTHYESFSFTREEFKEFEILGSIFKIIRTPRFDDL